MKTTLSERYTMSITEIKSWTGRVIWSGEAEDIKSALEAAVSSGADLRGAVLSGAVLSGAVLSGAVLRGAVLRGADLSGADLSGADLSGADLSDADLRDADLRGADLSDAVLRGAVLSGAVLSGAVLRGADLSDADLRGAVLRGAVLRGADLSDAVLSEFRNDVWAILNQCPNEVVDLRKAVVSGHIDGSTYEGECCCLVGTLAKSAGCKHTELTGVTPDASRPAEQWFAAIKKGDTPKDNRASELALAWVDEWLGSPVGQQFTAAS